MPILFVREILCLAMLSVGAYYDLKTREVRDRLWMVFGCAGLVLYVWEYVSGALTDVQMILVSTSLTAAVAIVLYRYGFFGGADAKALIAISVILPVYQPLMSFYVHPITAITVLTNAVLFALVVPIYNAVSNLAKVARGERIFEGFEEERNLRKILACFVGTPASDKEKMHHSSPIEASTVNGKKKFSFRLNYDDHDDAYCCHDMHRYSRASTHRPIWLSQNLPFLVFMHAGFLAAMLFGDILLQVLPH